MGMGLCVGLARAFVVDRTGRGWRYGQRPVRTHASLTAATGSAHCAGLEGRGRNRSPEGGRGSGHTCMHGLRRTGPSETSLDASLLLEDKIKGRTLLHCIFLPVQKLHLSMQFQEPRHIVRS